MSAAHRDIVMIVITYETLADTLLHVNTICCIL